MLNFIYNPCAGNGKSAKYRQVISEELTKRNIPHIFHQTFGKNHATEITNQLTSTGYNDIIVMGGDGTLHEVLNGISDTSAVNLGIIPCGSGNDFATSANIPMSALESLEVILNGKTKFVDYLECSGVRGMNIIGAGIDVEILRRCYNSKILKGKAKYLISTIISLIDYKCNDMEVHTDSSVHSEKAFVICAGNGKYFGGGIPIAPKAEIDDGELEFVLVKNMNFFKKVPAMTGLLANKILENPRTIYERSSRISIDTDFPLEVEIDGEIYSDLKFDVTLIHDKLKMFTL